MSASARRHLLVTAVSTLIALAFVEGVVLRGALGLRGLADLSIIQRDLEIGWSIAPNARTWHAALDFGLWVQTDALGLRAPIDERRAASQREGGQRILVLGDSFAFGWGVPDDRMFSSELERQLAARGHYTVRTAGVPGYSTDQEYLLWRRLATQLRPAQVVLLLHRSDPPANVQDAAVMGKFVYPKPRFQIVEGRLQLSGVPVPDKRALAPDSVFEPVKRLLRPFATYTLVQSSLRSGVSLPWRASAPSPQQAPSPEAYEMTAALLGALDADVRAHGATFFVALIPTDAAMTETLARICRTLGIPFLDLQAAFNGQKDVLLVHDRHWNAKGHGIAARAVAPFVR